eukprot:1105650-Amphidinium_carterae.1
MPQRPSSEAAVVQRGQAVVVEPAMLFYLQRKLDELKHRHDWRWVALAGALAMAYVCAVSYTHLRAHETEADL